MNPFRWRRIMSLYGYKRTLWSDALNVRFNPESGRYRRRVYVAPWKQTFNVGFTPESGRK
jgi:hypothetical protein